MVCRAAYDDEPQPEPQERAHRLIAGNDAAATYNEAQRQLKGFRSKCPQNKYLLRYFELPGAAIGMHQWQLIEMLG